MDEAHVAELLEALKALADASRLRILGLLSEDELAVGAIARVLSLSEPTISHHLARLAAVGFVTVRPSGTSRLYRLDATRFSEFQRQLSGRPAATGRVDATPRPTEADKVMKSFLVDGRLVTIPATRKKRRVVLEWLVAQLETGRRYTEKEINAFIKRFHADVATLRREFVAAKLMQREDSVYWRT